MHGPHACYIRLHNRVNVTEQEYVEEIKVFSSRKENNIYRELNIVTGEMCFIGCNWSPERRVIVHCSQSRHYACYKSSLFLLQT